jgi:mono/diheme cytochrome c family protein
VFTQPVKTVWDGVFTMEQAARGAAGYQKECASCHGTTLEGDGAFAPALIAEAFIDRWQDGTVGDLLIVVKATMPKDRPAALDADVYADIVAFILKVNNYPSGRTELSKDPAHSKDICFAKSKH